MAVSKRLRFEIFRRDNHTCRYCGRSAPEVILRPDHVTPVALGGRDEPANLVTACEDCNSGKSSLAPGSHLVADVEQDAFRWAAAQQLVAERMANDLQTRKDIHQDFDNEWRAWGNGNTPRPSNWTASLDSFLNAGLPKEIIFDCISRAMQNEKILHGDIFRYMCGIAWSRINAMRDQTAAEVQATPSLPPASPPGNAFFAAKLLRYLDTAESERAMRAVISEAEQEGAHIPEGEQLVIAAAEWVVADMYYRIDLTWRLLGDLFEVVPESMLDRCIGTARQALPAGSDELDMVPLTTVHLLAALKAAQITENGTAQ